MKYYSFIVNTQTSTFRLSEFQNFHKSFLYPPPTTLIGFFGAAMGLSPKASQDFFDNYAFEVGVIGFSKGLAKDLWKYRNANNKDISSNTGIITKEFLFDNQYIIAIGSENEEKLDELVLALKNPVYALTLGASDSIAKVSSEFFKSNEPSFHDIIQKTYIEGMLDDIIDLEYDNKFTFMISGSYTPIKFDLPVRFNYRDDYGIRTIKERKTFSLVYEKIKTINKIKGITYKDYFIPLFQL